MPEWHHVRWPEVVNLTRVTSRPSREGGAGPPTHPPTSGVGPALLISPSLEVCCFLDGFLMVPGRLASSLCGPAGQMGAADDVQGGDRGGGGGRGGLYLHLSAIFFHMKPSGSAPQLVVHPEVGACCTACCVVASLISLCSRSTRGQRAASRLS